jgi:hypothetical protein
MARPHKNGDQSTDLSESLVATGPYSYHGA